MCALADNEQVVAEQTVDLYHNHQMRVTISQHQEERFWRVEVANPRTARGQMTTTVATADNFMMNLIEGAVGGERLAWLHLAQWGQANLTRRATGQRACA